MLKAIIIKYVQAGLLLILAVAILLSIKCIIERLGFQALLYSISAVVSVIAIYAVDKLSAVAKQVKKL